MNIESFVFQKVNQNYLNYCQNKVVIRRILNSESDDWNLYQKIGMYYA